MAIISYPHAGSPVNEPQWRRFARLYALPGVVESVGGELEVSDAAGLSVSVADGEAYVEGFTYTGTTAATVTLAAADVTNDRIDLVVLRYDPDGGGSGVGTVRAGRVTGTPAPVPVAPSPTENPLGVYEIPLAEVLVEANSAVSGAITDRRQFTAPQAAVSVLDDLTDVDTAGVQDTNSIVYDDASGEWLAGPVTVAEFDTYTETVHDYGTVTTATNIDLELAPVQTIVLGDDVTLTVTGEPATAGVARSVLLLVKQDNTGTRDVTWSGVDVWFGEIDPTEWDADEERAVTIVATDSVVRAFVVPQAV